MYHYRQVAISERMSSVNQNTHQAMEASLSNYISNSPTAELAERQRVVSMIRNYGTLTPLEDVILFGYTHLTTLPSGFNPQENVILDRCTSLTALPAGFNPQGNVNLSHCSGLTELPAGFNPLGHVILDRCTGLTALPEGFNPQGHVDLRDCTGLTALPAGFNPQGDVYLSGCTGLTELPAEFNPQGHVHLSSCNGLTELPAGFSPLGNVDLSGCTGLTALPAGFNPKREVDLRNCAGLTALPTGFNPQGNVNLSHCTGLTELPAGFNPQGNVDLIGCTGLTALPAGFNPRGNVNLSHCSGLTELPLGFNPQKTVDLSGCTGLTALPAGFNPKGDVGFWGCTGLTALPAGFKPKRHVGFCGCTGLTSIPDSMFAMDSRLTVNLQDTGLNAATVANIILRMNSPGYSGPCFVLSVNDGGYRSESHASAGTLPELIASTENDASHGLWAFAASQTEMGTSWNGFAAFMTRLLNETPRVNGQIPEALKQRLHQIFTAMEANFERNGSQLDRCELINSVLSAAQTGIGTCIDKVKVGYVLMQLHADKSQGFPDAERKIALVNRTIELVEGINSGDVVLDQATGNFVPVRVDFSDDARYRVHVGDISQTVIVDSSTPLVDVKRIGIAEINTATDGRFKTCRIGDEVEDILNLIYHLPEMDTLHKIDMRFLGCRTMTAEHELAAAVRFIKTTTQTDFNQQGSNMCEP